MTFPMYFPSAFGPEPFPLPFATYSVRPSGETVTAVGYHPAGISPATRMRCASRWTTATALFPAIATYSARPSGESASALGSLPSGAWGSRATVSCSTTAPRARSTRAGGGERAAAARPPRPAKPDQPIPPFGPAAARPRGVAPLATGAGQPQPRRPQRVAPHDAAGGGVDPHQAVLAVSVVRHHQRPVGKQREVERQRAHRDLTARRVDAPAGGEQGRTVFQGAGCEPGGEEREAREGGQGEQGEQGALEHGAQYRRSRERRQPLRRPRRALSEARRVSFQAVTDSRCRAGRSNIQWNDAGSA